MGEEGKNNWEQNHSKFKIDLIAAPATFDLRPLMAK